MPHRGPFQPRTFCDSVNEPVSAQTWGLHPVPAPKHTSMHMGTGVSTRAAFSQAGPQTGTLCRGTGVPTSTGGQGRRATPSLEISAAARRSASASKAHHLPIKSRIKWCYSPPPRPFPLSLTSSPWGNYHLYMRFSFLFFVNLFSAPVPHRSQGISSQSGPSSLLEGGLFQPAPPWEPAPGQLRSMPPVLPSQFVPPNPRGYRQPLSHTELEQPNPLLSVLPR